jgi:hypothetical protein
LIDLRVLCRVSVLQNGEGALIPLVASVVRLAALVIALRVSQTLTEVVSKRRHVAVLTGELTSRHINLSVALPYASGRGRVIVLILTLTTALRFGARRVYRLLLSLKARVTTDKFLKRCTLSAINEFVPESAV